MIIAGVNEGATLSGKTLRDGGAAIIIDGKLRFATAEERVTRQKAAGGFHASLAHGIDFLGIDEIDAIFASSCCEPLRSEPQRNFVDHHESHAALAYFTSGFDDALIIVADDGGNTFGRVVDDAWWHQPRQQLSIYHGQGDAFRRVGQEFTLPFSCGLGEFYRAFTYFLGWPSGRHAGKVMALSGLGVVEGAAASFFTKRALQVHQDPAFFHPYKPKKTAENFLKGAGRQDLIDSVNNHDDFAAKIEVAAIVQRTLEESLINLSIFWMRRLGVSKICLAGGVALNCTAAYKIRKSTGALVYVPPGPSDIGQSVGNAILGYRAIARKSPELGDITFLGAERKISEVSLRNALNAYRLDAELLYCPRDISKVAARAIFGGEIIAWYQGRSEFGPRALGNRSILASPQKPGVRERLNKIKKRETFNPFAASCIYEDSHRFFEDAAESPHMTMAFLVKPEAEREIQGVVHADGTCRAQIFKRSFNPKFHDLLIEYRKLSGFGLVLNTSLNGPGEPIVENEDDVVGFLSSCREIGVAFVGDFIVLLPDRGHLSSRRMFRDFLRRYTAT